MVPIDQRGGSILSNLFNLEPPLQRVSAATTVTLSTNPTAATCYNGNTNSNCETGDPVVLTAVVNTADPCIGIEYVKFYRNSGFINTDNSAPWTFSSSMTGSSYTYFQALATCLLGGGDYWSNTVTLYRYVASVPPTITDPTTPVTIEYADTGTFGITWNVADANGNLDWMAVDDAAGGYDYSSGGADFYDGTISGSSDSMITTWNKDDWLGTKTFRGRVADTTPYTDTSANVVINIFDTTNPSVTSTPSNMNCEYAASGTCTVGNWAATDFLPSQYKIQRKTGSGGTYADVRSLTTWVSGNNYNFAHPKNLAIGNVYYYKAYFVDTSTNFAWSGETLVTQQDTTDPTQTARPSTPSNVEYNPSGSTTLSFWTGGDELPSEYRIMRDFDGGGYAQIVGWTSWTSSTQQVTYPHPNNLALGTYKYRVEWKDTTGNTYTSATAEITVNQQDTTNPVVTVAQNDFSEEYNSSLTESLVAKYELNGDVTDSTGNYNGTNNGVTFLNGFIGNAGDFESTQNDYFYSTMPDTLRQNGVTLTFWAKHESLPAQGGAISLMTDGGTSADDGFWWHINAGNYLLRVEDMTNGETAWTDNTITTSLNVWYFYVVVLELNSQKIFRNNTLIGEYTKSFDLTDLRTDYDLQLLVGQTYSETYKHDGLIDDVHIFNKTLSISEINDLYNVPDLSWTATDLLADDYQIERQFDGGGYAVIVAYGNGWTSGVPITYEHPDNMTIGTYNYRITFKDTTPNTIQDIVVVTQQDTTNPVVTVAQNNINVEYAASGTTQLSWTATDLLADDYQIEREFNSEGYAVIVAYGNGWTSGVATTYEHPDNMALGTYNYRITFRDTTPNTIQDVAIVTHQDTTYPVVTVAQNDINVEYAPSGSTTLSWTATDLLADDYQIEREFNTGGYSVIVAYGNGWTSGVPTTYEHPDNMAIGTYNYRITFRDTTPNTIQDIAVVTHQDTTYPVMITAQIDIIVEYTPSGTTQLSWTATDLLADDYQIEREFNSEGYSVIVAYGNGWTSGVPTTYEHPDNMAVGTYNYRITFRDTTPNTIQDIAVITVTASIDPIIIAENDTTYVQGYTIYYVAWSFTDEVNGSTWDVYQSSNNATWGSPINTGTWSGLSGSSNTSITYDRDDFYYLINVTDNADNWVVDYVFVGIHPNVSISDFYYNEDYTNLEGYYPMDNDVLDYSGNGRDGTPTGISYVNGVHGNASQFIATENDKIIIPYDAAFDAVDDFSISFYIKATSIVSQAGIISHRTTNSISQYSIRLWQTTGAIIWNYVGEDLSWHGVATTVGLITTTEFNLINLVYDRSASIITVYKNAVWIEDLALNSPIKSDTNTEDIMIGMDEGYDIYFDGFLDDIHISSDAKSQNYITYLYNQFPTIHSNEKGLLQFKVFDKTEGNYSAYMNSTLIGQNDWTNNTLNWHSLSNGTLISGFYNLTISIRDSTSNIVVYTYLLYYEDITPNIYIEPNNVTISHDDTGQSLRWGVVDPYPASYNIYRNNSVVFSSTWSEGEYISHSLSNLSPSVYNFTIGVADLIGNINYHTVWATILTDDNNPVFTSVPTNYLYAVGSSNNYLNWSWYDFSNGTYIIYSNGSQIDSGSFGSGNRLFYFLISGLSGDILYNITLLLTDFYGNNNTDLVWVYAQAEDGNPTIVVFPDDISYNVGDTGNIIRWGASDNHPNTYNVTIDGDWYVGGNWDSGNFINVNIDGLSIGTYTFILYVYDTSGNVSTDTVIVTVN